MQNTLLTYPYPHQQQQQQSQHHHHHHHSPHHQQHPISHNHRYQRNNYKLNKSSSLSSYTSRYPLYATDWSFQNNTSRILLSSYQEDSTNKIQVVYGTLNNNLSLSESTDPIDSINSISSSSISSTSSSNTNSSSSNSHLYPFWNFNNKSSDCSVKYPVSRVQWDPSMNNERFATTSECLRIYEVDHSSPLGTNIIERAKLFNSKNLSTNQLPPMTSFDWNKTNPTDLITCSIDTTCTVWNLTKETYSAKTQLIAHDNVVYDVKYIFGDSNIFSSCSADGSVRLFDLRNLEQSTIIYESTNNSKLVRLSTCNYNANQIAVLQQDSNEIIILDLRNISLPIYKLSNHSSTVNSIAWHPSKNILLTGSDDCQAFIYNFELHSQNNDFNVSNKDLLPVSKYSTDSEINYVCWSPNGEWAGLTSGTQFQSCIV